MVWNFGSVGISFVIRLLCIVQKILIPPLKNCHTRSQGNTENMNPQKLYVGEIVEVVDLEGYKHNGKRGAIVRLKRLEGEDYADVRLEGERRAIKFMTLHLKPVEAIQCEIEGLLDC